jgi:hypothetical protein
MELKVSPEILAILEAYVNSAIDKSLERNHDVSGTWLTKQVDEQCLAELTPQHPSEVARIVFLGLCRWVEQERQKYNKSEIGDDGPLSFPRKGGQGAENLRKKNRHVHEYEEDLR